MHLNSDCFEANTRKIRYDCSRIICLLFTLIWQKLMRWVCAFVCACLSEITLAFWCWVVAERIQQSNTHTRRDRNTTQTSQRDILTAQGWYTWTDFLEFENVTKIQIIHTKTIYSYQCFHINALYQGNGIMRNSIVKFVYILSLLFTLRHKNKWDFCICSCSQGANYTFIKLNFKQHLSTFHIFTFALNWFLVSILWNVVN